MAKRDSTPYPFPTPEAHIRDTLKTVLGWHANENTINHAAETWARIERETLEYSCAWHVLWTIAMENYVPTPCSICGGPINPKYGDHNLCIELRKRGLATPPLDSGTPKCFCAKCKTSRKEAPR